MKTVWVWIEEDKEGRITSAVTYRQGMTWQQAIEEGRMNPLSNIYLVVGPVTMRAPASDYVSVNKWPQHDTPERLPAPPTVEWTPEGLRVSGGLWEPHEALALAADIQKRYGGRGG